MDRVPPAPVSFIGSLRTLGDGLLANVEDRLELFATELQEEKFRLIQTVIWICAAAFTGMMAIIFASLTLVYLFWDSARIAVLGGFAVIYAGALLAVIIAFRRFLARQPQPFAGSLREIREDRACIRSES
jgi:uncharacterized membrane protein YqjE